MPTAPFSTEFAHTIYKGKYAHPGEEWSDTASRVTHHVMNALHDAPQGHRVLNATNAAARIHDSITQRRFLPGGRYLYAAGRPLHQVQNCLLLKADDSREGWAQLQYNATMALMTGAGIGVWYGDIRESNSVVVKTGGTASGPIPLMKMVNETGRNVMQGGARRCLPGDSLITMADYSFKPIKDIIPGDMVQTRHGPKRVLATETAGVKPIVRLQTAHGEVRSSEEHRWLGANSARSNAWLKAKNYSLQCKLYRHPVPNPKGNDYDLSEAYVKGYFMGDGCAYSSNRTHEVTYQIADKWWHQGQADLISEVMGSRGTVVQRPGHGHCVELRCRSKSAVAEFQELKKPHQAPITPEYIWGGSVEARSAYLAGWWDADGCYTKDAWKICNIHESARADIQALLSSLGIESNVCGNEVRICSFQRPLFDATVGQHTYKKSSGHFSRKEAAIPTPVTGVELLEPELVYDIQVDGEEFIADGFVSHNSAIWAGLPWWHPDVGAFIRAKDWPEWLRQRKAEDWTTEAQLDSTNISVTLDDEFFVAYEDPSHPKHDTAHKVYLKVVDKMVTTGEPGFSIDRGDKGAEVLRNACTEITSEDDSDVCNLGSLVLPRYESPAEFGAAVRDAALFLTAGSLYSDLPYEKVYEVREKNRRLGLGLIGVHEFLMKHGVKYGTPEAFEVLEPYMEEYNRALEYANDWQDSLGISRSVGATAIAPNGTIGIISESTPSAEPLFSAARRRVVRNADANGDLYETHVVVDPTAKRLVDEGLDPDEIEDAYTLSFDVERRFAMQAFLQRYTDHAISSTVNLPKQILAEREQKDFADTLYPYIGEMRGVTCYPEGARPGQPLTPVPLEWALENEGTILEAEEEVCANGLCGV